MSNKRKDVIDPLSPESLVRQFVRLLRAEIAAGTWQPGQRMPSEMEWTVRYAADKDIPALSRVSARKGLMQVEEEDKTIIGLGGRGWYRTEQPAPPPSTLP